MMATMAVKFVPDRSGVRQLFSASGPVGRHLISLARRTETRSHRYVGVDTGELLQSSRTDFRTTPTGAMSTVSYNTPYALYVHEGTAPHDIGSSVFIRAIPGWRYIGRSPAGKGKKHPGTKANPYLLRALEEVVRGG